MRARALIEKAMVDNGSLDPASSLSEGQAIRALVELNTMIRSMVGNGVGGRLHPKAASTNATVQSGYVYQCDTSAAAFTLTCMGNPQEGQTFGGAAARRTFAVHNLGISPNGRLIEGTPGLKLLSAAGDHRTWFYRADVADWVRIEDLALNDEVFFPEELSESLGWMLSHRLAIAYGGQFDANLAAQGHAAVVRRYGRRGRALSDPPLAIQTPSAARRVPTA